jgi:uncharacterized protein YggE
LVPMLQAHCFICCTSVFGIPFIGGKQKNKFQLTLNRRILYDRDMTTVPRKNTSEGKRGFPLISVYNNVLLILLFLVGIICGAFAMQWYKDNITPVQKVEVQGVGSVSVPATNASIAVRFPENGNQYINQVSQLTGELERHGISAKDITTEYEGKDMRKVSIVLHKDMLEKVDEISVLVFAFFPKTYSEDSKPYVEIEYTVDPSAVDLTSYREKVRELALNDALKNATNIAVKVGGKVKKAVAVNDQTDYSEEPSPSDDGLIYPDDSTDKSIQITAQYQVTYEVR